jgi:uncharacterized protein
MLIQFTVENFLSFRDPSTFSMVGVNSDRQHPEHLAENEAGKDRPVLPIAAIYGANGAGKSNLIQAVSFAKDLIVEGTRSRQSIAIPIFKLGEYGKKPSRFEFIFTSQGAQYSYGFSLVKDQILEEWLHGIPEGKKKEVMYFERITSSDKKTTVECGAILKGRSDKQKQFLDFIAQGTRPNQLFLTEAVDRNVNGLMPVFNWFSNILMIIPADANCLGLEVMVDVDQSFTEFLDDFLKTSGLGIDSIAVEKVALDINRHFDEIADESKEDILLKLNEQENQSIVVYNEDGEYSVVSKELDGSISLLQLRAMHLGDDSTLIGFEMQEESDGTQRLIHLAPAIFLLKESSEKVVFLDELDRRLHPLLSQCFLQSVMRCRGSANQLIFTTHDTNILDLDLFRRDEIWFVEKNNSGASTLYSLAEFKVRPDLKLEKGYLSGRFGAIPFFGDSQQLGWLKHSEVSEVGR